MNLLACISLFCHSLSVGVFVVSVYVFSSHFCLFVALASSPVRCPVLGSTSWALKVRQKTQRQKKGAIKATSEFGTRQNQLLKEPSALILLPQPCQSRPHAPASQPRATGSELTRGSQGPVTRPRKRGLRGPSHLSAPHGAEALVAMGGSSSGTVGPAGS